jgi:hypothetical protein
MFIISIFIVAILLVAILLVVILIVAMYRIWGYRVIDVEERSTVLLSKAERREYVAAGCFREPRAKAARMATRLPLGRPAMHCQENLLDHVLRFLGLQPA